MNNKQKQSKSFENRQGQNQQNQNPGQNARQEIPGNSPKSQSQKPEMSKN